MTLQQPMKKIGKGESKKKTYPHRDMSQIGRIRIVLPKGDSLTVRSSAVLKDRGPNIKTGDLETTGTGDDTVEESRFFCRDGAPVGDKPGEMRVLRCQT